MEKIHDDTEPTEEVTEAPKSNRGVNWRPEVLEKVDAYATSIDRSRSWVVNKLLETHPVILAMRGMA